MRIEFLQKTKPDVPVIWLYVLAGLIWSGVGVMLCEFAYEWLHPLEVGRALMYAIPGLVLAIIIHIFGFSRFAYKNIVRLTKYMQEKVCLFAFQSWTSYPLVIFMIGLGVFLRKYSPIPKPLLAILYLGIGGGLFFSSFLYHLKWLKLTQKGRAG